MARKLPTNRNKRFLEFVRNKPDFSVHITEHAKERMAERRIELPAIRYVLRHGKPVRVETDIRSGLEKHRITGRDPDGRLLEVVVNLEETDQGRVTVITAFPSESA